MSFQIYSGQCIGCGACDLVCPANCIKVIGDQRYIDDQRCISCGECAKYCPVKCIEKS